MKKDFDGTYYLCLLTDLPPWAKEMVEKAGKRKDVALAEHMRARMSFDGHVYLWSLSGHKITPESLERIGGANGLCS
jgi:hypothetical protein